MSTGRFYVTDKKSGRTFCVEPISKKASSGWGDLDPVTKKHTGSYGNKYNGAVHPDDSIVTEENGFKNIVTLGPGESPMAYINSLLAKETDI